MKPVHVISKIRGFFEQFCNSLLTRTLKNSKYVKKNVTEYNLKFSEYELVKSCRIVQKNSDFKLTQGMLQVDNWNVDFSNLQSQQNRGSQSREKENLWLSNLSNRFCTGF